jgi:hypothetical protein
MKNKTAWIIGGVVVFIILLALIGGSGSNNTPTQTTSNNNQPSLCSDIVSLKNQATTVNFKELDKNPDSFKGKIVKFTGQILQIQEADNYGVIRLAVTKESYGWSIGDVVYVEYQGHTDAVKDDVVTVFGQLTGSKTYESQARFQITVPSMTACVVEKGTGAVTTQTPITQPTTPKTTNTNQTQTTQTPTAPSAPALSVSCSASQTSLTVGQSAIWTAQVSGGTGSYSYSWSGTDGLSGNTQKVTKSYSSAGTKSATVNIVSGDQSVNRSCSNSVAVSKPAPAPINLSGSGQQASQKFNLEQGLSIFTLSNSGDSNFSVWLMDQNGNNIALLANTIGSFNGSMAVGIDTAGQYLLNVKSDGSWSVNITQPRPTSAPATTSFSDNGQKATSLFYLSSGLHVFNLNNNGNGNFSAWLMDQDGNNVELLANTIGSFSGSKAVGIDSSGIYLLNVKSSGNWTISIQ